MARGDQRPLVPAPTPGFHYECSNNESDKEEFEKALETMAVSFGNT